jgi:peptidoglycan hydrolase CwlO-like protein
MKISSDPQAMVNVHDSNLHFTHDRLDGIEANIKKLFTEILEINISLNNRRDEIDGIIETLQNLDNHDVLRELHLRVKELENG